MIAVILHGLSLVTAWGRSDQLSSCINNLRQIDGAKEQLALEKKLSAGASVEWNELREYVHGRKALQCPADGVYSLGVIGVEPKCSIKGHSFAGLEERFKMQKRRENITWTVGGLAALGFLLLYLGWVAAKTGARRSS